eukprot:evm.model.NODE_11532_length_5504_cov_17.949673.2
MPPVLVDDAAVAALFADVEAMPVENDDEKQQASPLPVRLLQDGISGEMVLLPPATAKPGDPAFFFEHIAATTTPFGLPLPSAADLLRERYLAAGALLDEMVSNQGQS